MEDTFFWEIHKVHKGMWASFSWLCFSCADWLGKKTLVTWYNLLDIQVQYSCIFLRVVQYLSKPTGQAKIQRTSKNIQLCYTLKRLISNLLSNCFDSEFCKQLLNKKTCGMMCDEYGGVFWLIEKTTCQSGSFQLNKQ